MTELRKGRPSDLSGRTEKEIRVYDLLDSLGIEYEGLDHDRADTMEACLAIDDALDTGPVECAQAHRARLARGIAGTTLQLEVLHLGTSGANSTHLSVGGRIIVCCYSICACGDNLAIAYDNSSKWASSIGNILYGEVDSLLHKLAILL